MEQSRKILVIDTGVICNQIWYTIAPTTPALERSDFTTQLFRTLYQTILEANADIVVFAMDPRGGYWRHREYMNRYRTLTLFGLGEDGSLWVRHDGKEFVMLQVEAATFTKVDGSKGTHKPARWIQGFDEFMKAVSWWDNTENRMLALRAIPKYKGKRGESKYSMSTPKSEWHELKDKLLGEIALSVGALYVCVPLAEADDVVAAIARNKKDTDVLLMVSVDGDWDQLQQYPNTHRLDPIKNEWIKVENPLFSLKVKVLSGDAGDNIQSVKLFKRSKKGELSKKITGCGPKYALELLSNPAQMMQDMEDGEWGDQLAFNQQMIWLDSVPEDVEDAILDEITKKPPRATGEFLKFGMPEAEFRSMRARATIKNIKYSNMPTADGDE